ncbi:MAG TPA: MaoC family dehydratase N-terminal domain-containing protein, partial [Dehalococcoidia bacterium]
VGVEVETGRTEVTKEDILAYCEAIAETNPLYTDEEAAKAGPHHGLIAPPTFCSSIRSGQGLDPHLVYGNATFHAGTRLEFLAPIRPGDIIRARTKVHDIYEKTGRSGLMVFMIRRTTYSNQLEQDVAISDQSMVYRQV